MQKRVLVFIGAITISSSSWFAVGCGGNGATSEFDASTGGPVTVDSGNGGITLDGGDHDATTLTISGGGGGGGGGGGSGDGGTSIDCDATPLACIPEVCGDSQIEPGETCDDGNTISGDGCSSTCQIEADYYACVPGQLCKDTRNCAELAEAGLLDSGSDAGCSAPPKVPVCGDGALDPGEACDTGKDVGTQQSGCAADCSAIFEGYACFTPGQDCVNEAICGDGKLEGSETCDEGAGNKTAGCSATCTVTPGWTCTVPGIPCIAAQCGDGIVAGNEQCDTGTALNPPQPAVPGCDANCLLATVIKTTAPSATKQPSTHVINYSCRYPTPNPGYEVCAPTLCGDGVITGTEQCDDGNNQAYDGCSPDCQREPSCLNNKGVADGTCVAVCGDGLVFDFAGEACDDGNTNNGDGCSSTCQQEPGYQCTITTPTTPLATVDVPVVYRDKLYYTTTYQGPLDATPLVYGHPDFERYGGSSASLNLVKSTLANGIPQFNALVGSGASASNGTQLTSAADFTDWYADGIINPDGVAPPNNLTLSRSVRIDGQQIRLTYLGASNTYVFDSDCDAPYGFGRNPDGSCATSGTSEGGFLPINDEGWDGPVLNAKQVYGTDSNFSFTTQFRYYFTFDAASAASANPPSLDFSGDDDVWVFVNNQLALDLGGLHPRLEQSFTLNTALANSLGLVDQHVYEVDLFNAERHTSGSNFKLTLGGFVKKVSTCTPVCGDGIRTASEQCDNGTDPAHPDGSTTNDTYNTNDGDYGTCTAHTATVAGCTLGPYCGDKKVTTPPEVCDNGINQTPYATSQAAALATCAPGCVEPAYCGDGSLQNTYGEACDNGSQNADNAYGGCTSKCALGPRCGDSVVQTSDGETCDNGFNATTYVQTLQPNDCAPGCKTPAYCGNGTVDLPYEVCDNGANNSNTGAYNSCTTQCKPGPHCGDGILQSPPEQCDDGNLVNGDGCSAACLTENTGIR